MLRIVLAYCAMCLIWGTTWLAIKIGLHTLGPLTGVGLRFVIAGSILYGVAALRRELVPWRDLPWDAILVFATSLCGLNYVLNYVSELRIDSGLAALLFGTMPFFVFLFGALMIRERPRPIVWAGTLVAFAGLAVISLTGEVRGSPLFALASVVAAGLAGFANVYAKRHTHRSPLVTLPPSMLLSGVVVTIGGLIFERTDWLGVFTPSSLGALLYLAVIGSCVAFFLFLWLLQHLPAYVTGLAAIIYPMVALAVGALFGGEHFGTRELIGSALVIAGLALSLSRPASSPAMASLEP